MNKTLKQVREEEGYSLFTASALLKISVNELSMFEENPSQISMGMAAAVLDLYHKTASEIEWSKAEARSAS